MIVEEKSEKTIERSAEPERTSVRPAGVSLRGLFLVVLLAALIGAYVVYTGLTSRARANSALERATLSNSIPTVATIRPQATSGAEEIELPGNMQAFVDTPSGPAPAVTLKAWNADIGAHVKRGQLLAEIEAPEVDQQFQQARAQLTTDQANLKLAQITAQRYNNLFATDSVAKQDVDNAVQAAAARTAEVTSAQANVSRLEQMVAYEKVYAPFDGVDNRSQRGCRRSRKCRHQHRRQGTVPLGLEQIRYACISTFPKSTHAPPNPGSPPISLFRNFRTVVSWRGCPKRQGDRCQFTNPVSRSGCQESYRRIASLAPMFPFT